MNRENGATKGRLGPTPEFSWSFSKSRNLQACGRLYYWTTYGFWGGWNADPSDSRWLAYRLKHLVSPALQIGILLHDAARDIAIAMTNGEPRPELARNYATILDGCWKVLVDIGGRELRAFLQDPKRNRYLHARYYGTTRDVERLYSEARARLEKGLANLLSSACGMTWRAMVRTESS